MDEVNLINLLDSLSDISVYVIEEETHNLLYFNKECEKIADGKAVLGAKCHEVWPQVCGNCPLKGLSESGTNHIVCFDPVLKTCLDVTATHITWDENVRAVVVTATPHRLNFEEEKGLKKVEQMYAQSLVTVFKECIIVNLTRDFYVNCQKDSLWTDIPEQGNFNVENQKYAHKTVHPDDLAAFTENFSRDAMLRIFGEGKTQINKRLRRLTSYGVFHTVEFTAARIERLNDDECWCVLVFRDVEEECVLERQRNSELIQLDTAARIAYQVLISVNLTQNVYKMLGYEREHFEAPESEGCFNDLIELEMSRIHPDYAEEFKRKFLRKSLLDAFMNGERSITMEIPQLGDDGQYHWNFTQVVRVEGLNTNDIIEVTLSRNIDEEKRLRDETLEKELRAKQLLEDALQKAEKASDAKSVFLSKMSHDIRTPMNAIVGITELAKLHVNDSEKLSAYLDQISDSGAHLLGLINEVLDVSKIENGSVELSEVDFDLRDFVGELADVVRYSVETKAQQLNINVDGDVHPYVSADRNRLKQVLVNVLENASKYTPAGGSISLSVRETDEKFNVGTYSFIVEDNGIGMKEDFIPHIFEPFSRAYDSRISKITGTGLGMTIVRNLVALMAGEMQIESEYGKGSRFGFTFRFPKCRSLESTEPEPLAVEKDDFSGIKVLLVEDNELNRQIATEMLEHLGVQVEYAEDGAKAVRGIVGRPACYYDLVFMDVQMPVMNGYDATRAIRNLDIEHIKELPIIAMTADAFTEDELRARRAGMDGHLAKPISIGQLKTVLSTYAEAVKNKPKC